MLPRSLDFELPENAGDTPLFRGGTADVSKYKYGDQEVAVKVLRVGNNLRVTAKVSSCGLMFHWTSWLTRCGLCRGFAKRS